MKRLAVGVFWVAVGGAALLIFGTLVALISGTTATRSPTASIYLNEATPSDLSPHGEIAATFNFLSSSTGIARDALEAEIVGRVVEWSLPVSEIFGNKDGLTIQTASSFDTVGTLCIVKDPTEVDLKRALSLGRGDIVVCRGKIAGSGLFGGLRIEPAMLIWR